MRRRINHWGAWCFVLLIGHVWNWKLTLLLLADQQEAPDA